MSRGYPLYCREPTSGRVVKLNAAMPDPTQNPLPTRPFETSGQAVYRCRRIGSAASTLYNKRRAGDDVIDLAWVTFGSAGGLRIDKLAEAAATPITATANRSIGAALRGGGEISWAVWRAARPEGNHRCLGSKGLQPHGWR
jgi:hypothetical protein